ncbi:MAG: signal peptidase II [Polyangiaceae bacterium]
MTTEEESKSGTEAAPETEAAPPAPEATAAPAAPSVPEGVDPSGGTQAASVADGEERLAPHLERMLPPEFAAKRIVNPVSPGPSGAFLAIVSVVSLVADVTSKLWAEKRLEQPPGYVDLVEGHLSFVLAKNKGGAWGLLQGTSESLRRPFFLLVSVLAIMFIVTLYRRLTPKQHALKWGLPLVLGGALGNVFDRLRYGHVIDFIDYRSNWVLKLNERVAKHVAKHVVTDHWPTFNVADIAICVGVILMAVDMFTSRRGKKPEAPVDSSIPSIALETKSSSDAAESAAPPTGDEASASADAQARS